jgi:hypothetical protein
MSTRCGSMPSVSAAVVPIVRRAGFECGPGLEARVCRRRGGGGGCWRQGRAATTVATVIGEGPGDPVEGAPGGVSGGLSFSGLRDPVAQARRGDHGATCITRSSA